MLSQEQQYMFDVWAADVAHGAPLTRTSDLLRRASQDGIPLSAKTVPPCRSKFIATNTTGLNRTLPGGYTDATIKAACADAMTIMTSDVPGALRAGEAILAMERQRGLLSTDAVRLLQGMRASLFCATVLVCVNLAGGQVRYMTVRSVYALLNGKQLDHKLLRTMHAMVGVGLQTRETPVPPVSVVAPPPPTPPAAKPATATFRRRVPTPVALEYGLDVLDVLRRIPTGRIDVCVTSPPYFRVMDYGMPGQGGREETPDDHIEWQMKWLTEVRRVLKPEGTLWLNYGDTLAGKGHRPGSLTNPGRLSTLDMGIPACGNMMLPEMLNLAMRNEGWVRRNTISWNKSATRTTPNINRLNHTREAVFMFATGKKPNYFNQECDAVRFGDSWSFPPETSVAGHPAPFPVALAERCMLLGCPPGGTVLDPFCGSGSSAVAAARNGFTFVGGDLNPDYLPVAVRRLS